MADTREAPFGHEPPGVATRRVVGVVLVLGTAVAIALVALWLALTYWVMPGHAQLKTRPAVLPPAPRLQPHPDNDLAALREEKRALLHGYAWNDKAHRFARIPIGRAMEIYAREQKAANGNREQGTGAGTPAPSASTSGPGTEVPGPGSKGRAVRTAPKAAAASTSPGGRR
ncbi:MAG TPA: hypothetical protein VFK29_04100 [Rhodanobacteraceae bacterium]|jgi:hypothetical protein|nr:hypothetical protein [Rhodanobacteraceae bacterium]